MGFNIYAAGTLDQGTTDLKRKLGYDQLLSQLNERKQCMDWITYKREHPECTSKLFIDSGAFTAHTKGKEIDVDDYIKFVNENSDQIDAFAQVDHIPGVWGKPRTPEELAEAPILSWENYLYMVDKVVEPKKLLPIFHQGEDFKYLKQMIEYKYSNGEPIDYIGISCNKELTSNSWIAWFNECFRIISESSNPNVKTHAFGMTSLKILSSFPFYSSDSTSWLKSAAMGNILVTVNGKSKSVYVSCRGELNKEHINNQSAAVKEEVTRICNKYDISLDTLTTQDNPYLRCSFNLYSLNEWAESYKCDYTYEHKEDLW